MSDDVGAFERLFELTLPFGVCVGVALPEAARPTELPELALPAALHHDEAAFAAALPPVRRASWVGGRVALRAALTAIGIPARDAILATPRGAPQIPLNATGSISHKRALAVALASPRDPRAPRATLGIDCEEIRAPHPGVAARVLTFDELAALPPDGPARDAAVLRGFSAKEAIYKALDPWVERFVGFQEAAVTATAGGGLTARLALTDGEGPFHVELHDAHGAGRPGLILIAARVSDARTARPADR